MAKLNKGAKERFDKQGALAVIMGARPFSLFKEPYMKSYIQSVSGNTYTPPSGYKIGGKELDSLYADLQVEVAVKLAP